MNLPFFRQAGSVGEGVVCIHSNASSSSQFRSLLERLAPRYRAYAPDGYGAGKGPPWPSDRTLTLRDEVALLEPVLALAGSPLCLVGHSYGGAVALMAALAAPERVRALVLYEPTLFSLLLQQGAWGQEAASGIRAAVAAAAQALSAGHALAAGRSFIDYWMGAGSFAAMPPARQAAVAEATRNVRGWAQALTSEPTPLQAFAALRMPVLLMVGSATTASARGVAQLLTQSLPQVTLREFAGLGHMGPVTHPAAVDEAIDEFLSAAAP